MFAHVLFITLGWSSWLLLLGLAVVNLLVTTRRPVPDKLGPAIGFGLVLVVAAGLIHKLAPTLMPSPAVGSGGYVGALAAIFLEVHFGPVGMRLILAAAGLFGLALCHDVVFVWPIQEIRGWLRDRLAAHGGGHRLRRMPPGSTLAARPDAGDWEDPGGDTGNRGREIGVDAPADPGDERRRRAARRGFRPRPSPISAILVPRSELANLPPVAAGLAVPAAADGNARARRRRSRSRSTRPRSTPGPCCWSGRLLDFGYQVRVVQIDTGPVITQFEIELEAGLRVSRIMSLADDLAIALAVPSVRIVAPIPGKTTVGIEVPNDHRDRRPAGRRDRRRRRQNRRNAASRFSWARTSRASRWSSTWPRCPTCLMAGRTGTGKSVCLNAMILSILMTKRPDEVKMILIDPKKVELSQYKRIPHLMHPVVTDMKKAESILSWACEKMEERYEFLRRAEVRNIDSRTTSWAPTRSTRGSSPRTTRNASGFRPTCPTS